jgi:hypothetical protein
MHNNPEKRQNTSTDNKVTIELHEILLIVKLTQFILLFFVDKNSGSLLCNQYEEKGRNCSVGSIGWS